MTLINFVNILKALNGKSSIYYLQKGFLKENVNPVPSKAVNMFLDFEG